MYLLHDMQEANFGFIPLTPKKKRALINVYLKKTKQNLESIPKEQISWDFPLNKRKELQHNILGEMLYNSKKSDIQLLTKKYKDKNTGKLKKIFTGIAEINEQPDRLVVPYMIGNPKAFENPKFKGAVNSLKQISSKNKKPIEISGINSKVEQLYTNKLNRNLPDND